MKIRPYEMRVRREDRNGLVFCIESDVQSSGTLVTLSAFEMLALARCFDALRHNPLMGSVAFALEDPIEHGPRCSARAGSRCDCQNKATP